MSKKEKKEPDMAINFTVENVDSALLEIPREDYQKPLNEKRVLLFDIIAYNTLLRGDTRAFAVRTVVL